MRHAPATAALVLVMKGERQHETASPWAMPFGPFWHPFGAKPVPVLGKAACHYRGGSMTARASFKEGDLRRALRVATGEGLSIARIEVNDNGAFVIIGDPETAKPKRRSTGIMDKLYGPEA